MNALLETVGLSEKEGKVYLACLKLGACTANSVAKESGIFRTYAYDILRALSKKGLISSIKRGRGTYFEAASPEQLVHMLEDRKRRLQQLLPDLKALAGTIKEKPKVTSFEGKEGLKTILEDILASRPKEILTTSSSQILEILRFYFPHWIQRRAEKGIFARVLQQSNVKMRQMKERDQKEKREIRFLPPKFVINTHIQVYGAKVAILTLSKDELIGILIENKDVAETQRSIFELMWNSL